MSQAFSQDPKNTTGRLAGTTTRSLTSQTYAAMRADIIQGVLEPSLKLKIEDLTKRYNVGASPIREALSLLTSDALVARNDQRGFRVVAASKQEFDELLKTRLWVEQRALEESIIHGGGQWEEDIVLATYRLSRVSQSSSDEMCVTNHDWEVLHKNFHMALISACGSSILLTFCRQLYDRFARYRHLCAPSAYPSRAIDIEHANLSDAVLARDSQTAIRLLVAHYGTTGRLLRENI